MSGMPSLQFATSSETGRRNGNCMVWEVIQRAGVSCAVFALACCLAGETACAPVSECYIYLILPGPQPECVMSYANGSPDGYTPTGISRVRCPPELAWSEQTDASGHMPAKPVP